MERLFVPTWAPQGPTWFQPPFFFVTPQSWGEQGPDQKRNKVLYREVHHTLGRGTWFRGDRSQGEHIPISLSWWWASLPHRPFLLSLWPCTPSHSSLLAGWNLLGSNKNNRILQWKKKSKKEDTIKRTTWKIRDLLNNSQRFLTITEWITLNDITKLKGFYGKEECTCNISFQMQTYLMPEYLLLVLRKRWMASDLGRASPHHPDSLVTVRATKSIISAYRVIINIFLNSIYMC